MLKRSLLLISAVFIFACGSSAPGETDGRKALQLQLGGMVENNTVKILSFKKTNGQIREGIGEYKMDWEAEIECAQTVQIRLNALFTQPCGANTKMPMKGVYYFDKTENGWVVRDPRNQ